MKSSQVCVLFLLLFHVAFAVDYHPPGYFDPKNATSVTWAHAVNSNSNLETNLKNDSISMLEADLVIGHLAGQESGNTTVIMAHPPQNVSDLSFEMFLKAVLDYNQNKTLKQRKGIKLDFKQYDAAEQAIPILKELRDENILFPVWINADILPGPVNASNSTVNGKSLMQLHKAQVPESTLSLGWTTRFGVLSTITGSYTKEHFEQMVNLIKEEYSTESSVEITFPLRAGLAVQSLENIKFLLNESGINFTNPSVTLWESMGDPLIKNADLEEFIKEIGPSRVFLDLPYSLRQNSDSAGSSLKRKGEIAFVLFLALISFFH